VCVCVVPQDTDRTLNMHDKMSISDDSIYQLSVCRRRTTHTLRQISDEEPNRSRVDWTVCLTNTLQYGLLVNNSYTLT